MSINTENLNYNDFKNICRTCLFKCDLKPLQDYKIIDILNNLTGVSLQTNGELPQQICRKCYEKLYEIHAFSVQCKQTYSSLMKCLNNLKNTKLKQGNNKSEETSDGVKIKEEITIEEHDIEFVPIGNFYDETNCSNMKIKEETCDEMNEIMIPETSEFNTDQNINCLQDDLFQANTSDMKVENEESFNLNEIGEAAIHKTESLDCLLDKSRKNYEIVYKAFMRWRLANNTTSFAEETLLMYFKKLSKTYKSSSLWTHYSMLKSTLSIKHNINLDSYTRLRALLKSQSKGYQAKKSQAFTAEQINRFINEAPDFKYLATKVALIMGITGACSTNELYLMKIEDLKFLEGCIRVFVPCAKTKVPREFTITDSFYYAVKKYIGLRPSEAPSNSLFFNYQNGKCTRQIIGINKFGAMGKEIAKYLQIPNPERYTGHCLRRSSATLSVNGASKRRGNKRNNKVGTKLTSK